jgi:sugar lactone lactonase YvrE
MSLVPNGRGECSVCDKERITYECKGCANDFCYTHLTEHRQVFIEQLGEVENDRDQFQEIFIQQKENLPNHIIMQQITKWENDSIRKIKQTAEESRQIFMEQAIISFNEIEIKLIKLNDNIILTREENEFNEIVLEQLRLKLTKLIEELAQSPNLSINQESSTYINRVYIVSPNGKNILFIRIIILIFLKGKELLFIGQSSKGFSSGNVNAKFVQNGITIAGGNGQGQRLNQLARPEGIFVDEDLNAYIADSINNRILKWKYGEKNGQVVAGGNGKGNRNDQLDGPTAVVFDKKNNSLIISDWGNRRIIRWNKQNESQIIISDIKCCSLAIDNNSNFYVADWKKNEIKRWKFGDKDGTVVAGGNGQGNNLNQLNCPNHIFVDEEYSIYISNYSNHRVVKWTKGAKEGIIIAGQKGQGNGLAQLSRPQGVTVDQFGQVYVADCDNHRILKFGKGDSQGTVVVGGKGQGDQSFQLNTPIGLTLDKQGHLYVVDSENHRVQKYQFTNN